MASACITSSDGVTGSYLWVGRRNLQLWEGGAGMLIAAPPDALSAGCN